MNPNLKKKIETAIERAVAGEDYPDIFRDLQTSAQEERIVQQIVARVILDGSPLGTLLFGEQS